MGPVELVIILLIATVLLALIAQRLNIAYPIILVMGGVALGFYPELPDIELDPQLAFTLFLPPILFASAYFMAWDDFVANLRPIFLLAFGLVLATVFAVAYAAQALIDLPLAAGFVLGAIVSPPDAVAAAAIASRLNLPRRIVTILEGESLVNDASGLVAFNVAVAAAVTGHFSIGEASLDLVVVSLGGIGFGLIVGWAATQLFSRMRDETLTVIATLLTPFAIYLPAEHMGVSGVLATVAAGIYTGHRSSEIFAPQARLRATHVWSTFIFLLNGLVFILIGLQMPLIMEQAGQIPLAWLLEAAAAIAAVVILVRIVWVYPAAYLPRLLFPRIRRREGPASKAALAVISWAGMRGIVSLGAALSLPQLTAAGQAFPSRPVIIFLAFSVIVATLVLQGLSLPWLIRWLGVVGDPMEEQEIEARRLALEAALLSIDEIGEREQLPAESIELLRQRYRHELRALDQADLEIQPDQERALNHKIMLAERALLRDLRLRGVIADEVFRRLQHELDLRATGLNR
jgi:Na+/H+ antiporter